MYLEFYNLNKGPFHITPDPEFLFLSPSHKEALASIIYGVEERKGFITINGDVGVGKTTIVRSYLEKVDKEKIKIVYIFNPDVSFKALLQTIFVELGMTIETDDVFEMVNHLHHELIETYKKGNDVVLIIDEAQNIPVKTLESLRMLSNLETSKDKLLQIVLIAQPEFDKTLSQDSLRQLRQRIVIKTTIQPLTEKESAAYIQHRLAKTLNEATDIFTPEAIRLIVRQAKGIPRILNILCDNALISGYGYKERPVSEKVVKEVIAERRDDSCIGRLKWALAVPLVIFLFAGFYTVFNLLSGPSEPVKENYLITAPPYPDEKEAPQAKNTENKIGYYHFGGKKRTAKNEGLIEHAAQATAAAGRDGKKGKENIKAASENLGGEGRAAVKTVIVKEDDSLFELTLDAYGCISDRLVEWVGKKNPHIKDTDYIEIGDSIRLPRLDIDELGPILRDGDDAAEVTVKKGDTVFDLSVRMYGCTNEKIIERITLDNPQIADINNIEIGDKIRFAALNLADYGVKYDKELITVQSLE